MHYKLEVKLHILKISETTRCLFIGQTDRQSVHKNQPAA